MAVFWTFVQLELTVCKTGVVTPFPITNSVSLPSSSGAGCFSQWCRFTKMVGIQPQNKHTARAANGRGGRSVPAQPCCLWRAACPGSAKGCWKFHHPCAGQQFILGNAELEAHAKQLPVSTAGLHGFWEGREKQFLRKRDGCSLIDTGWIFFLLWKCDIREQKPKQNPPNTVQAHVEYKSRRLCCPRATVHSKHEAHQHRETDSPLYRWDPATLFQFLTLLWAGREAGSQ